MNLDIVVPVHSNKELVERCLEAVFTAGLGDCRLVVIDDSGDQPFSEWLKPLCAKYDATLIVHESNLGFVRAANTAFEHATGNDVILLNSDTVVHGDWWARLQAAAHSASNIATVTPLSNSGDICSYPLYSAGSAIDSEALDGLCASVNGARLVEIPTGVGFCLYIRGDCLKDIGHFDVEAFGRGYGEENDFCLRASARGWRHMCHTGVYVEHVGGASFGDERRQLMKDADQVLATRYPDFQAKVEAFLEADPLAVSRDTLTQARLQDPQQISNALAEFAGERKTQLSRYYDLLRSYRKERDALNQGAADFAKIVAELRKSNSDLAQDHRSLENRYHSLEVTYQSLEATYRALEVDYRALESNHASLSEELDRVRLSFQQADEQLYDCRHRIEQLQNENTTVNQLLETAVNERDYFEAEAQRLAALWPIRAGRWLKRLLRS